MLTRLVIIVSPGVYIGALPLPWAFGNSLSQIPAVPLIELSWSNLKSRLSAKAHPVIISASVSSCSIVSESVSSTEPRSVSSTELQSESSTELVWYQSGGCLSRPVAFQRDVITIRKKYY